MNEMKTEKTVTEKEITIRLDDVAADAGTSVSLRRGWEADTIPSGAGTVMPRSDGSRARRMMRAAFALEAAAVTRRISPWMAGTADSDALTVKTMANESFASLLEGLLRETIASAVVARMSESARHPLAASDREKADLAMERLVTLFTPRP